MSDSEENPRKRQRLDETSLPQNTPADTNMSEAPIKEEQTPAMSQAQQEAAVGITAYVSPEAPGFDCIVKQRYTDFLVHEILPSGEVLHLTDTGDTRKRQGKEVKSKDGELREATRREFKNGDEEIKVGEGVVPAEANAKAESNGVAAIPQLDGAGDSKPAALEAVVTTGGDEAKPAQVEAGPVLDENAKPTETPAAVNGKREAPTPVEESADATAATTTAMPNGMHPSRAQAIQQGDRTAKKAKLDALSSISNEDRETLIGIFGDITTESIIDLYATIVANPGRRTKDYPSVKSEVISDKSKRTDAHIACRRIFSSKLETAMIQDSPGTISIKCAPAKGNDFHRSSRGEPPSRGEPKPGAPKKNTKLAWDDLGGEYLHFTLYKENKDTMEVLYYIGSQLKIPAKTFQFAGTKDRRGCTVQKVCILRVHADRVAKLNRDARGWKVGGFEYKKHGLDLGELTGNEFVITLRDCHFAGEDGLGSDRRLDLAKGVVSKAGENFQAKGFLNYYGLQRFGSFAMGTHATGLKMLQGNLKGAVDAILTYKEEFLPEKQDALSEDQIPRDDIARADAIRNWRQTGKSGYAIDNLPKRFQAESAIIKYLAHKDRNGRRHQETDWQGALMMINRNLRLMYVHAYQSLVFNTVAAKRWELHGDKVVEGDLVVVGTKEKPTEAGADQDEVDESGEPIIRPAEADDAKADDFTRARHLSKAEADSGKFDIFDIVLPLPGWDVSYPANELGKFYEEFMASEAGGGLDPHNMRRTWKDISLSGDYRKMMSKPGGGFSCEVKEYVEDNEQMVETDLEKLQKPWSKWKNFQAAEKAELAAGDTAENGGGAEEMKAKVADGDKKLAVIVRLQLGSSQYATMALRELCKGGAGAYKPDWSAKR